MRAANSMMTLNQVSKRRKLNEILFFILFLLYFIQLLQIELFIFLYKSNLKQLKQEFLSFKDKNSMM